MTISDKEIVEVQEPGGQNNVVSEIVTKYGQTVLDYTCGAGVAGVNVANGRLLFEHSDIVVGGGNFTIGIKHIYDSYGLTDGILKKLNMKTYVGEGWKLNIQQYLFKYESRFNLAEFTPNDYLYIDEKGYFHRFINIEGDSSRWHDTSGLGMVLKSIAMDENISHNAINFSDGSMLLFSKSTGCLIESRKMTCYTTYISKVYEYKSGKIKRVYDLRNANGNTVTRYLQFDYNKNDLLEKISLMPNDIKNDSIFLGYDENNNLKYIVDYINEKEKGIVCFDYNLTNLLTTSTSTTHQVGLEFLYGDAAEIRNVKKGHTKIVLGKNISYEKSTNLSLNQVISVNDFFIAVAEEKTDLLSIDIKEIKDDEVLEVTSYKYPIDYKSNQEIKTIVTNKNDVSFVYYLNQKGVVVSMMENYVDTNLKTLTKDGGILFGDDGKLMNCINGSSMIKANIDSSLKKTIQFDYKKLKKYHDSKAGAGSGRKAANYIASFWFKSKSTNASILSAKVKVKTVIIIVDGNRIYASLETPITYIDHTAYNSWQYVNLVINGALLDMPEEISLEISSDVNMDFEYSNFRIAAGTVEELTLSSKLSLPREKEQIGISRNSNISCSEKIKLIMKDMSIRELTLNNKNYLTEQDIITNYNNIATSSSEFDFYYNGLTKGISKVSKAFVYIDGNYEELKATKIGNTMNKEINLVYRQTSPNWNNKVIKTYEYIGQDIKEIIKVNDGKKESSMSRIYAPNNLLLEEENSYGVKTRYVYDNYDILTKKKISKGSEVYEEVYEYDSNNEFMLSSKDITGNVTNVQMNPNTLGIVDSVSKGQVKVNTVYDNYNRIIRVFNNSNESIGNNITYDSSNRIKTISDSDDYHYEIDYDIFGNVSSYSLVDKNKKTLLKEKHRLDIDGWDYDAYNSYDYQTGYSEKVLLDKYGRPFRTVILKENVVNGVTTLEEEARVFCNYQGGNMLINDSEFSPKFDESQSIAKIKTLNDGFEKTAYEYKYDNDNNLAGYTQTKGDQINLVVQQISDNETKYEFKGGERYKTSVEYNNDTIEPRIIATSNYDYDFSGLEGYTQMLELCNVYEYDDILGRLTCIKPAREKDAFTIEANLAYKDDGVLRNKPTSMDLYFSTFDSHANYKGYINYRINYNEHDNIKDIFKEYSLTCKYNSKYYNVISLQGESKEYAYDKLNRLVKEAHYVIPSNENDTIELINKKLIYEKSYYYTNDSNKDINKITKITDSRNEKITKFEYDKFNRLTSYGELTPGVDNGFGIIDYGKYTFKAVREYTYGSYLNPTKIKVSNASYDLTWNRSNLLTQYGSASYKYNYKGIRFEKTDLNGLKTVYYYDGDKILGEDREVNTNGIINVIKLRYFYDLTGIIGFTYKGIPYRYIKDVDGNIEWLVRYPRVIAKYDYDSFGNCVVTNLSTGGEAEKELNFESSHSEIGRINPIRWRSQYLDTDTGYYYMNQRYYDPKIGQYIDSQEIENIVDGAFIVGGLNMYGATIDNHISIERNHNNILTKDELAVDSSYDPKADKSWWQLHWKKVLFASILVTAGMSLPLSLGMFKAATWGAISGVVIGGFLAGAKASGYGESFWGAFFDGFMDRFIDGFNTGAILYCIGRVFVRTGNCFIAGTLVQTESGHKSIENIEVGDKVWAYDEETGDKQLKEVVHLFRNTTDTWYHIEINNEKITCTKEHPFYIDGKGWVNACDLVVNDGVLLYNGNRSTITQITREVLETPETTYNFEVRDYHTYYVGTESILVHNTCTPGNSKVYSPDEIANRYNISVDDFHTQVKPEILNQVKPKAYLVGKNPDIALNKLGEIAYQGARGSQYARGFQDTGLNILDIISKLNL